jgi:P27 family predicted phage terminase small subunit
LRGNPGKRPVNENEPQPEVPPEVPNAPSFLTGHAADEWYRVAEELHNLALLTRVDIQPLAAYCQAYAIWRTAVETLAEVAARDPAMHGLLSKSAAGTPLQSPLVMTIRHAANDMVRYASEFGLTPSARSRISSGVGESQPNSKFGPLLVG